MSRELWLLRHGKAERFDSSEDYDRTLKGRGKRDAIRIGEWLKEGQLIPEVVISSPAIRAITTAKIVCDVFGIDHHHIQQEKRLYDEGLVRVNETDLPDNKKLFPTAALARLILPDDWSHLEQGCAQLLSITYPKSLFEESAD